MKYDLNVPAIKWRVGFGDDPELAAGGVTSTGAPGLVNSVIVTASGLLFGAGRDDALRVAGTAARLDRVRGAAQVTHVFQCSCR